MSILHIQNVSFKHQQHSLLKHIELEVIPGEHWLLVGPSGSGKTVLLNTIAGVMRPTAGDIQYSPTIKNHISLVTSRHHFKDKTNTSTNLYYQQRYNSSDSDQALTVLQLLQSKAVHEANAFWTIDKVTALLRLQNLLPKELIKLSNGESKRLRLAMALLAQPRLLLLDDPLSGLDQQTQLDFDTILQAIVQSSVTIIMSGSGYEIPATITHVAVLQHGTVSAVLPAAHYHPQLLPQQPVVQTGQLLPLIEPKQPGSCRWIVNMTDVNIRYDDHLILNQVNWQVKPGQCWALLGHNGAGKSTLLSLINGDNPQAYANDIVLFDRKRGTGESIWDIKRKIGFLSPELYQFFPTDQSALQVIESGYYDTQGLFRASNPAKAERSMQWLKALHIDQYAYQLLKNIPASAQRLCLLARAFIKNPDLLILDEPCQGLDQQQRRQLNALIDALVEATGVTLIYVTHYMDELPACISHTLTLAGGRVVE